MKKKNKGRALSEFEDNFFKCHDRNEVSDTMDMTPIINKNIKLLFSMDLASNENEYFQLNNLFLFHFSEC